jgi:hypothetical protein
MTGQLTPTITWHYWDGDEWIAISEYVLDDSCSGSWGMNTNRPIDRLATPGEMSMSMDNSGGKFDPDNANVLTGWAINTKVKLTITYDSFPKIAFYGHISDIEITDISTTYSIVNVTVLDWMDYAYRFTITQQSIETYKRGDQVAETIVDAVGHTPQATEYNEGAYEYEAAFDSMTVKTKAATELNKIVLSEGGYFYNRHDRVNGETLVFEDANYRNGLRTLSKLPVLAADCGDLLKAGSATDHILMAGSATDKIVLNETVDAHMSGIAEGYERTHGDNVLNKVTITAYPKRTDTTEQTLYSLGEVMKIASGETKVIKVRYQNAATKESCNAITSLMIQPVATTDYLMNSKKDGTGTDITSDLTVTVVYYTAEAEITLYNANATRTGKITKLQLRGYGVYQDSSIKALVEDTASQTAYSECELNIEQQYQRDTTAGEALAGELVSNESAPRTILNRVSFIANKSDTRMFGFLAIDIGDMVKITESNLNLANYYYVNGVEFSIYGGGIIAYSWILSEAYPSVVLGSLTPLRIENGSVNYGVVDKLLGNEYVTILATIGGFDSSIPPDVVAVRIAGYSLQIGREFVGGFQSYLNFINNQFETAGDWRMSDSLPVIESAYLRVGVGFKPKDITATPTLYFEGSVLTPTTTTAPVGSWLSDTGGGTYFGNGLIDINRVRIYNRALTSGEITSDFAGTEITDGLILSGPYCQTRYLAEYDGQELTSDQPLYDGVDLRVGFINDAGNIAHEDT